MKITKDTICCISIALRPGNFGATVLNTAFETLNLDYIYKPFRVSAADLEKAVKGIRAFNIRGCGVSMPHKVEVMRYLDKIDDTAQRIGAVNTIVNDKGFLIGYNTDYEGARRALKEAYDLRGKSVLIIGAGGVARAIIVALKDNGASEIYLTNRDEKKGEKLAREFSIHYLPFAKRGEFSAQLLVNATSVGMPPDDNKTVVDKQGCERYNACMDVVVSAQKTLLIREMEELKKTVIPGFKMALYQGLAQFKLYTGASAPENIIENAINSYFIK
jgi:shikimate dehydrogenase